MQTESIIRYLSNVLFWDQDKSFVLKRNSEKELAGKLRWYQRPTAVSFRFGSEAENRWSDTSWGRTSIQLWRNHKCSKHGSFHVFMELPLL